MFMKILNILQKDTKVGRQNLATKLGFVPDCLYCEYQIESVKTKYI